MTIRTRLTQRTLATEARRLSGDVDGARWALAELAAQAKAEGVENWAAIIGVVCRRQPHTVACWARTWEWADQSGDKDWLEWLPYSFYETATRYLDRLNEVDIMNLMSYFHSEGGTLEAFRAELATMAGDDGSNKESEFRLFTEKERARILGWIDRAPSRRASDCLRLAADALSDALTAE